MPTGTIFNIQKCSIHDGPGIRTLVFFKGCPLRCKWCANPESQSFAPQIMNMYSRCVSCMMCIDVCEKKCIYRSDSGRYEINYSLCDGCGKCAEVCFAEARTLMGRKITVQELFEEIKKDQGFFNRSGGGVTFSGGEPLMQPEFLKEIAKLCKENGIKTAMESCGCGDIEKFGPAMKYIDFMYFDVKHMDPEIHKKLTGMSNEMILKNLKGINDMGTTEIVIRTPVIPGYNDSEDNIIATAEMLNDLNMVKGYELLAYHNLGENKYDALGRKYELHNVEKPSTEFMNRLVDKANSVLRNKKCFYES